MFRNLLYLTTAAALLAAGLAVPAVAGESHVGTIERVSLTRDSGFVHEEASFKEVGAGSSQVAVWIEVYEGPSGPLKDTLARKTGTSACQAGRTCFSKLRTGTQALRGECYVGWASTSSGGTTTKRRSPASARLCP
jgi:hypothetical protein